MAAFNSSTEVIASMFLWSAFLSRSHIFSSIFIYGNCVGQDSDFILFLSLYSMDHALWTGALEDEVLWWKVIGSDWPQIVLRYILIYLSIKISKKSAHSVVWNTSPDHYSKLLPRQCVHAFWLPFFSGFSPNVDVFSSPNLHFALSLNATLSQYPITGRCVQFASAPGQSVSSVWYTQSNCLPNHPSLIIFLAKSKSYSTLSHWSRSALIKCFCNFLQRHISRLFDILEQYPLCPRRQDQWPSCSWSVFYRTALPVTANYSWNNRHIQVCFSSFHTTAQSPILCQQQEFYAFHRNSITS